MQKTRMSLLLLRIQGWDGEAYYTLNRVKQPLCGKMEKNAVCFYQSPHLTSPLPQKCTVHLDFCPLCFMLYVVYVLPPKADLPPPPFQNDYVANSCGFTIHSHLRFSLRLQIQLGQEWVVL